MKQRHKKRPERLQEISLERIKRLFEQAELRYPKSQKLADRYVELARKIAMKYKVKIPKEYKRRYCKHCHTYLVPGSNCRVRLREGKIVTLCHSCKSLSRLPIK